MNRHFVCIALLLTGSPMNLFHDKVGAQKIFSYYYSFESELNSDTYCNYYSYCAFIMHNNGLPYHSLPYPRKSLMSLFTLK